MLSTFIGHTVAFVIGSAIGAVIALVYLVINGF